MQLDIMEVFYTISFTQNLTTEQTFQVTPTNGLFATQI